MTLAGIEDRLWSHAFSEWKRPSKQKGFVGFKFLHNHRGRGPPNFFNIFNGTPTCAQRLMRLIEIFAELSLRCYTAATQGIRKYSRIWWPRGLSCIWPRYSQTHVVK